MGRSNPTYRDTLRAIEERWSAYRRALRRRDQPHFDRLFEHARDHADAAGYLDHDQPIVPVLVSIAVAQEREIARLRARVDDLESEREDRDSDGRPWKGRYPPWRGGTDLDGGPG